MKIDDLLKQVVKLGASDLHITVGVPCTVRVHGKLQFLDDRVLTPEDTKNLVKELTGNLWDKLTKKGEIDFSYSIPGLQRFRVSAYRQRNTFSAALRLINTRIPTTEELGLPPVVRKLARQKRGLILVTGPTGSGKSTTLASMIDDINQTSSKHIITLEDPIEYLFVHKKSIINQREIGTDTLNFPGALRATLRQDPDVILVGEMRDLETIAIALTAAETGHLVLSTLHTLGAAATIDRIIDVFPPNQQQQVRMQLALSLQGIISQQLLTQASQQGRVAAVEVMTANPAVRNMIREGKIHQLNNIIKTNAEDGMQTMDDALCDLYRMGQITQEDVYEHCIELDYVKKVLLL
jgi:twitching motility protein PilT